MDFADIDNIGARFAWWIMTLFYERNKGCDSFDITNLKHFLIG